MNFRSILSPLAAVVSTTSLATEAVSQDDILKNLDASSTANIKTQDRLKLQGYLDMCNDNPIVCKVLANPIGISNPERSILNKSNLAHIDDLNRKANKSINPLSDMKNFGLAEKWQIAFRNGDCEDIAMYKYHELLKSGFDPKNMHFLVVQDTSNSFHLVLAVRLSIGGKDKTIILDNLHDEIYTYSDMIAVKKYKLFGASKIVETKQQQMLVFFKASDKQKM